MKQEASTLSTTPATSIMADSELDKTICIIGSGAAGLISARILLQDGFKNVEILTRDHSVGGTWAEERVPPGLKINK